MITVLSVIVDLNLRGLKVPNVCASSSGVLTDEVGEVLKAIVKISRFLEVLEELGLLFFNSQLCSYDLLFLLLLFSADFGIGSADGSNFVKFRLFLLKFQLRNGIDTYLFSNFLLVYVVEEVLGKELDGVVGLL